MNNTVNEETPGQNVPPPAITMPESAQPLSIGVPRPLTMVRLINQWQPMGIRIVVNVPFVTDDTTFFFMIRNTPFIPKWNKGGLPFPLYAYNNMRNVYTLPFIPNTQKPEKYTFVQYPQNYGITYHHYDYPPVISTFAESFRKWRGDMQYRIRTVAGFVTQAYFFVAPLKNSFMPIGVFDEYKATPIPRRLDTSYRELMTNSYVMTDASMFRHAEVTVPYEYPVPWFDQYQWMDNRCYNKYNKLIQETHGDNWIVMGARGNVDSTEAKTIVFELEYRCSEGFQFASPGLPPKYFNEPIANLKASSTLPWMEEKKIPDPTWDSDGLAIITPHKQPSNNPTPPPKQNIKAIPVMVGTKAETFRMEEPPPQPSVDEMRALYSSCSLSASGDRTYCKTDEQRNWDVFDGDQRWRQGQPRDAAQAARQTGNVPAGIKVHKREADFD